MSPCKEWFEEVGTPPDGEWWWAVEHDGHPAFYMRSLMAGDFAPGRVPLSRHALGLDGVQAEPPVLCGTCGTAPASEKLEPIERRTGARGFLELYRQGRSPWPTGTDQASCWQCSNPRTSATRHVMVGDQDVRVCNECAAHLLRQGATEAVRVREEEDPDGVDRT